MHLYSLNKSHKILYLLFFLQLLFLNKLTFGAGNPQGYIGASLGDASTISPELKGVYVFDVLVNAPAQVAGLKKGDIIQIFDGYPVLSFSVLFSTIRAESPGKKIPVTFLRSGKLLTCELIMGAKPVDPILIDTIKNYITMLGSKCVAAKKAPIGIFDKSLGFGAYAIFEREANFYVLQQKWDAEDAEPGRYHLGAVSTAKFPDISTILDSEHSEALDNRLATSYRNGKNFDNFLIISVNDKDYALYTKQFTTTGGKEEFLVTGLLLYDDYLTVLEDKWEKKDNLKLLAYNSEDFRKLSGQILAANNNDLLTFYVLEGTVEKPGTPLQRKVWLESGEASQLKQRFEQDKLDLFSNKFIVLITAPSREIFNNPLLKWDFNNQYDLNAGAFYLTFRGDLSIGLLDLESAFPVKWDIPRNEQLTETGRNAMRAELAKVFKEMGLASKQVENEIEYYDTETKQDVQQYIYSTLKLGVYDQIRKIKSKYRQSRTGILEIKVPAKEAERIDGNKELHIALVFSVSPDTIVDPYSGESFFKCRNGELRILDSKTYGRLFVLPFNN